MTSQTNSPPPVVTSKSDDKPPQAPSSSTTGSPTIVYEKPHEAETLQELSELHAVYTDLLEQAEEARVELHTAVRVANRVHGIKQETIGQAIGGVSKSRVYAIITALDEDDAEEQAGE